MPEPPQKDQTPHSPMPPSSSNPFCSWAQETKGRSALHGLREGTVPLLQCSSLRDYIEPRAFVAGRQAQSFCEWGGMGEGGEGGIEM